jgi:hypothetical protein
MGQIAAEERVGRPADRPSARPMSGVRHRGAAEDQGFVAGANGVPGPRVGDSLVVNRRLGAPGRTPVRRPRGAEQRR